jgi:hypothetical protein
MNNYWVEVVARMGNGDWAAFAFISGQVGHFRHGMERILHKED